uniref:Uncharacterized protein n=1 Tax=viral metagenome TaxID=1070528 RepID=A0A6H1ZUG5_9ZZZZ
MDDLERIRNRMASQEKAYEKRKAKLREHYQYARDKGCPPIEARALSFETKEVIDNLVSWRRGHG